MLGFNLGFVFIGGQVIILFLVVVFCSAILFSFFKYEARLNKQGRILKEEWLGFKLYLEVADKYTYQRKLTPDLCEKYLPYAMIFGVEKKWAHAFDSIQMPVPQWYGGYVGSTHSYSSSFFLIIFCLRV